MCITILRPRWRTAYCYVICDGDHRDLNVLTPTYPTRRSSDLRIHLRWNDGLATNIRGRLFNRHHARELDDSSLGAGIAHLGRTRPAYAGRRRDIDNGSAALALHDGQHMFAAQENTFKIEIQLLVPGGFIKVHWPPTPRAAYVVHQHVDPAIEIGRAHV